MDNTKDKILMNKLATFLLDLFITSGMKDFRNERFGFKLIITKMDTEKDVTTSPNTDKVFSDLKNMIDHIEVDS